MKNRRYRHVSNMFLAKSMINLCVNMGTRVPDNVSAVDDIFNELFGADRFASRIIRCEDSKMILFMIDKYVGRNNLERLFGSKSLIMAMKDLINLVSDIKYTRNRIKDKQKHGKNVDALKKELKFYNKAYKKTIIEFKSYLNLNAKGYKNKYKELMNFVDRDKDGFQYNFGLGDFFDDDLIDEDEEEYSKYNELYRLPDVYTQEDLDNYNAYMDYQRMIGNAPDFKNGSFKMMNPKNSRRNTNDDDYRSSSGYSILDGLSDDQVAELGVPDEDDDDEDYDLDAYIYGEDYANRRSGRDRAFNAPRRDANIHQQNMYDPRMDKMMDMMSTLISLQTQNVTNNSLNSNNSPSKTTSSNSDISELKNQVEDLSKVVYDVINYLTEDEDDDEADEVVIEKKNNKPVVEEDPAITAFNKLINDDDDEIEEDEDNDEDEDEYEDIDPEIFHLPYKEFLKRVHEYGIEEGDVAYKQLVNVYKEYWERLKAQADAQLAKEKAEAEETEVSINTTEIVETETIADDGNSSTEYSDMDREELVNEFNNSEPISATVVDQSSGATTI